MKKNQERELRWIQYQDIENKPVEVFIDTIFDVQQVSVTYEYNPRMLLCVNLKLIKSADRQFLFDQLSWLDKDFGVKNVWFRSYGRNFYKYSKIIQEDKAEWLKRMYHPTFKY